MSSLCAGSSCNAILRLVPGTPFLSTSVWILKVSPWTLNTQAKFTMSIIAAEETWFESPKDWIWVFIGRASSFRTQISQVIGKFKLAKFKLRFLIFFFLQIEFLDLFNIEMNPQISPKANISRQRWGKLLCNKKRPPIEADSELMDMCLAKLLRTITADVHGFLWVQVKSRNCKTERTC